MAQHQSPNVIWIASGMRYWKSVGATLDNHKTEEDTRRLHEELRKFTSDDLEGVTTESIMRRSLEAPCRICGDEHGMLKKTMMDERRVYSYNCPVARYDDWVQACREKPTQEYELCPRKFAEVCHFDGETVLTKMRLFKDRGEGYCMSDAAVERLQQEILRICDEVRNSWTFTRDTSRLHLQDAEEEGDGESEDDNDEHLTKPSKKPRSL